MAGGIIPREGLFTADALTVLLKKTVFNPTLTLPIYLLLQYSPHGQRVLASLGPEKVKYWRRFKVVLVLALWGRLNRWLSRGAVNNWTRDRFDAKNEVVVVTGGSSGIGAAIVKELTRPGRVKIKAIVVLDIQPLGYEPATNVHYYRVDLSNPEDIKEVCARVRDTVGNPTVLINNAGVCRGKTVLEAEPRDIRLTFAINAESHYILAKEFLPSMISANHGHIITVASIGAYVAAPKMVDYNSSKAAAQGFHEGLTLELKYTYKAPRVRTTLVSQGYVKTPLFAGFQSNMPFLLPALEPETLAEEVVEQVYKQSSGHIILPRVYNLLTGVRGWPLWQQVRMRSRTASVMNNWHGKQVIE